MKEPQKYGNEITLEEIKMLQMDILTAIDRFCHDNGIKYSMACGTLLGAIRHKGYIPWDDDIDIYLLRKDYNRLISEFPETYSETYKITSLERSKSWDRPYAKGYDSKTILVEDAYCAELLGVNIDIYPIDDVPDDETEWLNYDKHRRKWQRFFNLTSVKRGKSRFKTFIFKLIHFTTYIYPRRNMAKHLDKMAKRYNNKGCQRCFENVQGVIQRHPFRKSLFDNIKEYPFEDRLFSAFSDADEYLTNGYGNYMELPPVEKRLTHHAYKAYWKQ